MCKNEDIPHILFLFFFFFLVFARSFDRSPTELIALLSRKSNSLCIHDIHSGNHLLKVSISLKCKIKFGIRPIRGIS